MDLDIPAGAREVSFPIQGHGQFIQRQEVTVRRLEIINGTVGKIDFLIIRPSQHSADHRRIVRDRCQFVIVLGLTETSLEQRQRFLQPTLIPERLSQHFLSIIRQRIFRNIGFPVCAKAVCIIPVFPEETRKAGNIRENFDTAGQVLIPESQRAHPARIHGLVQRESTFFIMGPDQELYLGKACTKDFFFRSGIALHPHDIASGRIDTEMMICLIQKGRKRPTDTVRRCGGKRGPQRIILPFKRRHIRTPLSNGCIQLVKRLFNRSPPAGNEAPDAEYPSI